MAAERCSRGQIPEIMFTQNSLKFHLYKGFPEGKEVQAEAFATDAGDVMSDHVVVQQGAA